MRPVEVILLVLFLIWVLLVGSRTILLILELLLLLPCWDHVCGVISTNVHVVSLSDAHASLLLDQVSIWVLIDLDSRKTWRNLLHALHHGIMLRLIYWLKI